MFEANSRYSDVPLVAVKTAKGNETSAVPLRRLPSTQGDLTEVKGTDRLDMIARRKYKDGTRFWHVADANTELEANDLVERERSENPLAKEETRFILVPGS